MTTAKEVIDLLEAKTYQFKTANLEYVGVGRDSNGNKLAKFKFLNGKGFSIQSNGNLPEFHRLEKGDMKITDKMEKEAIEYISKHGSKKQKDELKVK